MLRVVAEGAKGLTLTLRAESVAAGLIDKGKVGGGSEVLLQREEACVRVDFVRGAVASEGVLVLGVVVCESGVEPGEVCRTESRKEKVWETGLRLSPVINARLPLTSPAEVVLVVVAPAALLALASGLRVATFSLFAFCSSLADIRKSSTHIGS